VNCLVRIPTLALLLLAALSFVEVRAENAAGPDEVVRVATDELLGLITEHRSRYRSDPEPFFRAVDESMSQFVDYPGIARAVMAAHWGEASESQRERFIRTFRHGLVRSYARAMVEFDHREIEVLPLREDHVRGDRAIVRMRVTAANGRTYPLHYSMAKLDGEDWKVRNVTVNGVNLGQAYRSQFASAMRSGGGMDQVIENWSTAPPDDLEKATDA
jgi:phospholipid transport system substrate-binding protein